MLTGEAGETLIHTIWFSNGRNEPVDVRMVRQAENLPTGWSSALCDVVCYPVSVSDITFDVPANAQVAVSIWFFTNPEAAEPDTGAVEVWVQNQDSSEQQFELTLTTAATPATVSRPEVQPTPRLRVYPNPASGQANLQLPPAVQQSGARLLVYSADGQHIQALQIAPGSSPLQLLNLAELPPGLLMLRLHTPQGKVYSGKLLHLGE